AGRSIVYIDPYRVSSDAPKADLILVTHGHYDHFSPQDLELLSHKGTWLVAPAAVAERVSGNVLSIAPGEMLEDELVRGVAVTPGEAAEAARRIAPRVAVPMHWGELIGTREDAEAFAEAAPGEVRILEKVA